jgi:hypothetical protein
VGLPWEGRLGERAAIGGRGAAQIPLQLLAHYQVDSQQNAIDRRMIAAVYHIVSEAGSPRDGSHEPCAALCGEILYGSSISHLGVSRAAAIRVEARGAGNSTAGV